MNANEAKQLTGGQSDESATAQLFSAARQLSPHLVFAALAAGADIRAVDSDGNAPLEIALGRTGNEAVLEALIRAGAKVANVDIGGLSIVRCMVLRGMPHLVALTLDHGADINELDKSQRTPLFTAAAAGEAGVLELLLERGANVQARDSRGNTALHSARGVRVVDQLLSAGIDIAKRNDSGKTAIDMATGARAEDTLRHMLTVVRARDDRDSILGGSLLNAASDGDSAIERMRLLREAGCRLEEMNMTNQTPLHIAAGVGALDTIRFFIEEGVNIDGRDAYGDTALLSAAASGHADTVLALLSAGADPNAANDAGRGLKQLGSANPSMAAAIDAWSAMQSMRRVAGRAVTAIRH